MKTFDYDAKIVDLLDSSSRELIVKNCLEQKKTYDLLMLTVGIFLLTGIMGINTFLDPWIAVIILVACVLLRSEYVSIIKLGKLVEALEAKYYSPEEETELKAA